MRNRLIKVGRTSALIVAGLLASVMALAQNNPEDVLVDVNLKDAEMVAATRMLTERTGLQFLIEPNEKPFKRITLRLEQTPAKDVLKYICQAGGASYRRDGNGVYIISMGAGVYYDPPVAKTPEIAKPLIVKKFVVIRANAYDVFNQVCFGKAYDPLQGFRRLKEHDEQV